jgi:predicted RNase H-like nuclease
MTVLGIDGCRAGWCVSAIDVGKFEVSLKSNIHEIIRGYPDFDVALIDIPIGLGDNHIARDVERAARQELSPIRHHSIFTPPVREAITACNYVEAKKINQSISGKKISLQSWNISPKIAELDLFLQNYPAFQKKILESHPEICFKYLNQGSIPSLPKNAPKYGGIKQRLLILKKFQRNIQSIYDLARSQFASSEVKNDDIVDALCLAITAKFGRLNRFDKILGSNKKDTQGINMAMHYYNTLNH